MGPNNEVGYSRLEFGSVIRYLVALSFVDTSVNFQDAGQNFSWPTAGTENDDFHWLLTFIVVKQSSSSPTATNSDNEQITKESDDKQAVHQQF